MIQSMTAFVFASLLWRADALQNTRGIRRWGLLQMHAVSLLKCDTFILRTGLLLFTFKSALMAYFYFHGTSMTKYGSLLRDSWGILSRAPAFKLKQ